MLSIILSGIFIFILGLCIGSFLNCVIYRLEEGKKLSGRSFCPHCKHTLKWLDLFPIFSFIFLAGKCRYCQKKISVQYPLVEFLNAVLFLAIFLFLGLSQPLNLIFLFYIASSLVVIFVYDLKHYEIPDKVLFPAIAVALIYNLFFNFNLIINYGIAVVIAAGFFLAIFVFSGGKWIGFGDVKFAILMGLLLGISKVLTALFLAFLFGAIISIILLSFYGKKMKSEVPFGPFLVMGTFLALFYGEKIVKWYLSFFLL